MPATATKERTVFFKMINREGRGSEVLFNVYQISKIEVQYGFLSKDDQFVHLASLETGVHDTDAVRVYKVTVAGEVIDVYASNGGPVLALIEEIYKNAIG